MLMLKRKYSKLANKKTSFPDRRKGYDFSESLRFPASCEVYKSINMEHYLVIL